MLLRTYLVIILGFLLPLAATTEPFFSEEGIKLNKLTQPLRILGFFPYNGYSHFVMFNSLMLSLAKRGHNVTVVSPFPLKSPIENYTDIDLSDRLPSLNGKRSFEESVATVHSNVYTRLKGFATLSGPQLCHATLTHSKVAELLRQKNQFDVLFTEVFGTDCFLAVGHILQVPTINMVTSSTIIWMHDYVGETNHPAIVPTHFIRTRHLHSVLARVQNTFYNLVSKFSYHVVLTRPSEAVLRDLLGDDIPSLAELRHNVSLVMLNSHPSIFGARPAVPRILHVAGIHLQPADPHKIPEDIRIWLDTASRGVLYFSLGSLVNGKSLPVPLRAAFIEAFAELKPLRVLWKFEQENVDELPDNVKVAEWLPQVEILSHPNLLAFMTHAGAMGMIEAVYYGVPMIGIPIFADQLINTNALVNLGCAVHLDHTNLTKEDVYKAVVKAVTDPTIRRRAKEVSRLFRDRPMTPLDSAMWWTEYVVRHGGAHHLESQTARLPFWQYALLDVIIVVIVLVLLMLYVVYFVFSRLRALSSSKITENKKRE